MPSLNIRNVPDDLMRDLKKLAAAGGQTLRDYCLQRLGINEYTAPEIIQRKDYPGKYKTPGDGVTVYGPIETRVKPTAKTLADSIPFVTVASEIQLRPKHSANCSCFMCKPPKA